jgi:hypothetical protein
MARKTILDTYYTFNPSTRQIVIPRPIQKEHLVLITDVTTNQVIFNFSDPNLTTTSYVIGPDTAGLFAVANSTTITTITLSYNTTSLSSTDKLQIVVDEYDEKFSPSETYLDPINKLRVSTPQSLIDTDYEYSTQTTKWENLSLLNNQPYAYYVTATGNAGLIDIQATNGSRSYVANTTGTRPPTVGTPIVVLDSLYAGADGLYIVEANNNTANSNALNAANTFTYTGKYYFTGTTGSVFNTGVTIGYQGYAFSNSAISISSATVTGNNVTVTTGQPHNLVIGNEISLTGANTANGSWQVAQIISPYTFVYNTTGVLTPTAGTVTTTNASLYPRPTGLTIHRAFDGGVRFSTNGSSHNQQYIRQTRRYFRYQSGKGIQMSTGTVLKSQLNLDGLQYVSGNNTVIVTTKDPHNINYPTKIFIDQANESGYNGLFTINNVISPYQFTYTPNTTPVATQASGFYYGSVSNWYGATNRIGIFDSQNGMFWQYDGQTLSAVKRNSTYQLSGLISVATNSSTVTATTGFPTFFNKQLAVNDFIVIKGMTYRVTSIASDTSLTISPPYRGLQSITNAVASKTIDLVIPTSQFNIDRLDGTGPSGYTIDLTKMQMFYIDYSWYGAGFIRFGVRGPDGNVIYCHRIINNNVNYLAYMRSGNLPGRYETNTFSKTTFMTGGAGGLGTALNPSDTVVYANSVVGFPTTGGTLLVKNSANVIEYMTYSGISGNSFTISARGQAGVTTTGNWTSGNNYITSLASTTGIQNNQYVYGPGIPSQSFVVSIQSGQVQLSQAPFSTQTGATITFAAMANTAQTFPFSTTAQTSIELHSPQFGPEINHWGTSAIMDGGFTADKSFIFTKGMITPLTVAQGNSQAVMSFRISPSASNGVAGGGLGIREVINRMQHLPFETDIYSNGSFLITCYLNPTSNNATETWQNVGGSSLSQYIFHNQGTTVTGGEAVFGFYLNTQQGVYQTTQQDLTQLLAIGHSILGGGTPQASVGIYPNGPDVLTFVATNIDTANRNIQARYSWNEAQA